MSRETKVLVVAALIAPFLFYGWVQLFETSEPYSYMAIKVAVFYVVIGFTLVASSNLSPDRTGFPLVASLTLGLTAIPVGLYAFHILYVFFIFAHVTIAIFGTLAGGSLAFRVLKKQARSEIKILPFQEIFRDSLAEIYLNSRRETFYWLRSEDLRLEDFASDTNGETLLVALHRNRPIGFISIWLRDSFVHHLYLDSRFKGLGAGKRLLMEGLRLVSRPARLKCVIQNKSACGFYEALGWRKESSGTDPLFGEYNTYLLD